MTKRLLATVRQENRQIDETTFSHEWWFTDDVEVVYTEGMVVTVDEDNPGNPMRPKLLIIPMRLYDEVKLVEKE